MKLVSMTYYIGMHSGVRELLEQCGITSFTHWSEVTGRLSCGEPREGTDVWPGYNTALQAVLRDETAAKLAPAIREFNRNQRGDERIDAYFLDIESTVRAASEYDAGEDE